MSNCFLCKSSHLNNVITIRNAPRSAQDFLDPLEDAVVGEDLRLVCCTECGHYQLANDPVDYWKECITSASLSAEMREFRKAQLSRIVERFNVTGRCLIQVGCSDGGFFPCFEAIGFECIGTEKSHSHIQAGRRLGRDIRDWHPQVSTTSLNAKADVVLCLNFLEHSTDPLSFLRNIQNLATDEGIFLIEVPNFYKDLRKNGWYNLIRDHLSYFVPNTFSQCVQAAGYDVLEMGFCWGDDGIYCVAAKKNEHETLEIDRNRIRLLQSTLVNYETVAFWGASHQALTVISTMNPGDVSCIFDTAQFKQGKIAATLGIEIQSPEHLDIIAPDIIVISAAGYSDEVFNFLRQKHKYNGKILFLRDYL